MAKGIHEHTSHDDIESFRDFFFFRQLKRNCDHFGYLDRSSFLQFANQEATHRHCNLVRARSPTWQSRNCEEPSYIFVIYGRYATLTVERRITRNAIRSEHLHEHSKTNFTYIDLSEVVPRV